MACWVSDVYFNSGQYLTVSVWHSQAVSKSALPWIGAKKCGTFSVHIVHVWLDKEKPVPYFCLVLFAAEAYTSLIKDTACTSHPCEWLSLNFKNVNYAPICNTDFSAPTTKRKRTFDEGKENESVFKLI